MDPYIIGGMRYGAPEANELRTALIESRDQALGPEGFDAGLAVKLTHTIGLLHALLGEKWPEYQRLPHEAPKYGPSLDKRSAIGTLTLMRDVAQLKYDLYLKNPTPERRRELSTDINQIRLLLDAIEQSDAET